MSNRYPSFTATLGGCATVGLPFLWFFDWKPWAWITAGIFCVLMCCVWLSEALKVYRSGSGGDAVSARSSDEDDSLSDGKVVWRGSRQIRFAYAGYESDATDREVTVQQVVSKGSLNAKTYFRGHCHLRNESRTFRVDRIKGKVADTSTGEMMTFRQLFDLRIQ